MTPEEKLCSRTWRLRNSAGVLWSILSFGLLTGVGFLVRGIKSKNKLWIGLGIGFLVVGVVLFVTPSTYDGGTKEAPIRSVASTIWGWSWFTTFASGVVLTFIMNRKWLIWKAHSTDSKWYAQAGSAGTSIPSAPAVGFDPNAGAAALTRAAAPTSQPSVAPMEAGLQQPQSVQGQPVDINSASAQDMTQLLGVGQDVAHRIVQARTGSGPFTSFEQLMVRTGVQPHLLIPLRHQLMFGPGNSEVDPRPAASSGNPTARRLDL